MISVIKLPSWGTGGVTFTKASGVNWTDYHIMSRYGNLVVGSCGFQWLSSAKTKGTWYDVGTISPAPPKTLEFLCHFPATGAYAGMLMIDANGLAQFFGVAEVPQGRGVESTVVYAV